MKRLLLISAVGASLGLWWGWGSHPTTPLNAAAVAERADTWDFSPLPDAFDAQALLDLRGLNETQAGETGFVGVDKATGDFVRGDGKPLRFWAVNSDVGRPPGGSGSEPDLARHARFLAKRGVNLVRLHRQIGPDVQAQPQARLTDINEAERDAIWRSVAAMRKEGIYTVLSPYWSMPMKLAPQWLAGGAQSAFGLLFFEPVLQQAYKQWLKRLLTEKNPYTGVALGRDPSVALLQLQNEDSLLFWTVDQIKGPQRQALEERLSTFLLAKYGSALQVEAAWQGDAGRSPSQGPGADSLPRQARTPLLSMAELTQPGHGLRPGRRQRQADQTEFYARLMFDFNQEMVRYLRDELGVKTLVNAGNWKTADPGRLGDLERWSYTPAPVDAVNRYTSGSHQGPNANWAIQAGDTFVSHSVLHHPRLLPMNLRQTAGRPMLVTEGNWVLPNAYAAEGPFLVSVYGGLSGVDGYTWFSTRDEGWGPPQSANGHLPSQAKWTFTHPDVLGNFPAAALAYRMGYVQRGKPVLLEQRRLEDLWQHQPPLRSEEPGFDPNRDELPRQQPSSDGSAWPAEAFLVGPVQVGFEGKGGEDAAEALSPWIDKEVVRANTGQIVLNHAQGFCTVDAPQVQGVAAHFAKAPVHQLSDVRFVSGNAFGVAMAVSMDDAPLKSARRILVQYGTQSQPQGWKTVPASVAMDGGQTVAGSRLVSHGQAPWQVIKGQLRVSINNPQLTRATVLDMNGMPVADVALQRAAHQVSFSFPPSAMYVVLQ